MEKETIEKLFEIQKLKDAGVLTEKEFEEQKKRILEEDKNGSANIAFPRPAVKIRNLYSDILNRWSKFYRIIRLDQKKQGELSASKLSLFVLAINIVAFTSLIIRNKSNIKTTI